MFKLKLRVEIVERNEKWTGEIKSKAYLFESRIPTKLLFSHQVLLEGLVFMS